MISEYSASIEWLCPHAGIVRVHRGDDGRVGDPYVWCCTLVRDGATAHLKGAVGAPPLGGARALIAALGEAGFRRRTHERLGGGSPRFTDQPTHSEVSLVLAVAFWMGDCRR